MTVVSATDRPSFRWEADMLPGIAAHLRGAGFDDTFYDVETLAGVPDVVAVRWDHEALADRRARGLGPLTEVAHIRVLLALTDADLDTAALAVRSRISPGHLRRVVLPRLSDLGWVDRADDRFRTSVVLRELSASVTTVEAKLADWRRALMQARRHLVSADRCYLALDAAYLHRVEPHLGPLGATGLGVLSVDSSDATVATVLPAPAHGLATRVQRQYLQERCWALQLAGQPRGWSGHVFGRYLPDPVLAR
jgi:hypothetical protein